MNVTELITKLKEIPGHLNVFFPNEHNERQVKTLEIEESTSPKGIKYLLLTEADNPPITELRETDERFNINSPQVEEKLTKEMIDSYEESYRKTFKKPTKIGGTRTKISKETNQEIIRLAQTGKLKQKEIALKVGCTQSHVCRLLKKTGNKITITKEITIKKRGKPKKNNNEMEKEITVKEKKPHKCFLCHEPVKANTGVHAKILGENHKKLTHKDCWKEYDKREKTTLKSRRKPGIQKDFRTYQRRCKKCGKPKDHKEIRYSQCRECRSEK